MSRTSPETIRTAAELLGWAADRLQQGQVFFGHGTDNARDEAAAMVFHVMGLDHNAGSEAYSAPVTADQIRRTAELLDQRIDNRAPLPYLLNEAWFAGLSFYVDERVLIPRSPLAELIEV